MINYDLTKIKALAFDVDGVLSTNNVYLSDDGDGQPQRTANIKDGYAMQLAVKCGLKLAIITGGRSAAVKKRYENLGVQNVFAGISVKIACFQHWLETENLKPEEVLYMGDDIPDYEVMRACGLPCCPADAAEEIKRISCYISDRCGGVRARRHRASDACERSLDERRQSLRVVSNGNINQFVFPSLPNKKTIATLQNLCKQSRSMRHTRPSPRCHAEQTFPKKQRTNSIQKTIKNKTN